MTSERQFEALLRSWLDASASSDTPQGLLESVVSTTAHTLPRPAWLVRLGGEPMPQAGRGELNRFAPLAIASTALIVALLIGIRVLIGPPNIGPPHIPSPSNRATAEPSVAPTPARAASWTATGSMLEARTDFLATLLRDGRVLVAGGLASSGAVTSAELYDPRTGSWTPTGSMNDVRYSTGTATLLPDGRVLVTGGGDSSIFGKELASAELYDPARGTWTATQNMHRGRLDHTATLLRDGRVLVAGGQGSSSSGGGALTSAELYDPRTGSWTTTGSMIGARYGQTATLLPDGRVLVVGGDSANSPPPLASAEVYDPLTGAWTTTGSILEARDGHASTLLDDGMVLLAGGFAASTDPQVSEAEVLASTELYDPETGAWIATGSMIEVGEGRTTTRLPNGTVLVAGGYSLSNHVWKLTTAELYDPNSGSWTATASPIGAHFGPGATLLRDGMVLLVGGYSITNGVWTPVTSAELYDPGSGS